MPRSPRQDEDEVLDPVEAADDPYGEEEDELDGFSDVDPEDPDELDLADEGDDVDDVDDVPDDREDDELDDALVTLVADEDEIAAVVAATEDDDEDDTLREGEFVCRSCFMAKRESALADEDAMLCRDCV